MNAARQVCMTDSKGRTLFSIPDGGIIRMLYGNGEDYFAVCRYLDEAHAEIDGVRFRCSGFCREDGTKQNQLCPCLKAGIDKEED